MIIIRIYDKDYNPISTLVEKDYQRLGYTEIISGVSDMNFIVSLNNNKITKTSIQNFNKIELIDNGITKFSGYISRKEFAFDTAVIRCRSLEGLLEVRMLNQNFTVNQTAELGVEQIMDYINNIENTYIETDIDVPIKNVNITFNRDSALSAIRSICQSAELQFRINPQNRKLVVRTKVGQDRQDVVLQYNINQIQSANIAQFTVTDSAEEIQTVIYARTNPFTTTRINQDLVDKFGRIEKYVDYRNINSLEMLENKADSELSDGSLFPQIQLSERVVDNFFVDDRVRLILYNKIIELDNIYQINSRSIQYDGNQKKINISIDQSPSDIVSELSEIKDRLKTLENNL